MQWVLCAFGLTQWGWINIYMNHPRHGEAAAAAGTAEAAAEATTVRVGPAGSASEGGGRHGGGQGRRVQMSDHTFKFFFFFLSRLKRRKKTRKYCSVSKLCKKTVPLFFYQPSWMLAEEKVHQRCKKQNRKWFSYTNIPSCTIHSAECLSIYNQWQLYVYFFYLHITQYYVVYVIIGTWKSKLLQFRHEIEVFWCD